MNKPTKTIPDGDLNDVIRLLTDLRVEVSELKTAIEKLSAKVRLYERQRDGGGQ